MKISYSWLKEYIKIDKNPEIIAEVLTDTGLEVEGTETFEQVKGGLKGLVVAEVLTCEQHAGADKLSVTTVDVGADEPLPIVCGAPNVAKGQKVVVALVGTTLYGENGESFKIKKAKIRGEASQGMICAEDEIGLGEGHDGIMELDTDLPNGTPAAEFFNLKTDTIFEIGLTPNRADAASHFGTARDLKAFYEIDLQKPSVADFKVENTKATIEVAIQNTEAGPRFSGVSITGLEIKTSPEWLQTRLKSIGLAPVNNVVDATNYVLHSFGQPLHAYDLAKVTGNKIIVKTLAKDTKFISLDEKERKLSEKDLMICDGKGNPMCIGGVFGGLNSGVSESTTSIFLESAYFSPEYIRRSANFHELSTDASYRFARGTDPRGTIYALKYAALLIKELAGGVISSEVIDIYPNEIQNFEISVKYKNIDRLIGKSLDKELIKKILVNLDIEIKEETAKTVNELQTKYETGKKETEINSLKQLSQIQSLEINQRNQVIFFTALISISVLLIVIAFYKQRNQSKKRKQVEMEQRFLRSQLNPHFISNSLVAVQSSLMQKDLAAAESYLLTFSRLMREILENSRKEKISVEDEMNMLRGFLKINQKRLNNFEYNISIDESINQEMDEIPSMLLQPFVENAIEHGLSNDGKGHITIEVTKINELIKVAIRDNGVGFSETRSDTSKRSLSTTIIRERIALFNEVLKTKISLDFNNCKNDADEVVGAEVILHLPMS